MSSLAAYLKAEALSNVEFARRIGVADSQVCRWLAGERKPSAQVALRIERVTKGRVRMADLYRRRRSSARRPA